MKFGSPDISKSWQRAGQNRYSLSFLVLYGIKIGSIIKP